jgi:hypothetical protein
MTTSVQRPAAPAGYTAEFTAADLDGRWRSATAPEVFPGIYGIDDFWLRAPFWGIHFNSYSDPECEGRLFELVIMGTFLLGEQNAATPGGRDGNFSRVKVALCLHSDGVIEMANQAGSGDGDWKPGVWQDVTFGGCMPIDLPGIDTCPFEYDLLGLTRSGAGDGAGDLLWFGQRHHDELGGICDRRAPGLLPYAVTRVVGEPPQVGHGAGFGPADWTHLTSTTRTAKLGGQP